MTFPNWGDFTPETAAVRLARELASAEAAVAAVEKRAAGADADYETVVWSLTDATRGLWETWGMAAHELSVMNSPEWRKLEEDYQPKIVAFSLRVAQSRALYEGAKRALAREKDPLRRRVLGKSVQGSELAGVGLEGERKRRFSEIQTRLSKLSSDFANAVIDATAAYKFEKDGKTYTIDDANYPETMKHCADRTVRENLYRARCSRAPENAARISEILALRAERAKLLGYATPADVSLATKCAPSVKAVFGMIDALDGATAEPEARERAELEKFAGTKLEPWDLSFQAERLRESRYAYSEAELKRHFEAEAVLKGLFRMTKFLFGVDVVEVSGAEKPSVWHPDVRFFAVKDGDRTVANFYVDPYVRNGLKRGGAWMNEFGNRCDRLGRTPLAVLVLNFPEKDGDGRCLLPLREVETVFHEFGHSLQCMLTTVGDEEAAGINLVEWDAVEVASQFMENWVLDDRTGIAVPADLKAKVRAAKNFRAATACRRQLAFAKLDMVLHSSSASNQEITDSRLQINQSQINQSQISNHTISNLKSNNLKSQINQSQINQSQISNHTISNPQSPNSPNALKEEIFRHFGLPSVPEDRFLCAFTHIFAGGYAAGYYGYKWAEVMSADCYGAFEDAGLRDDAAVKRVGAQYRATVLGLGGSISALEVFRRFRGRDPEIAALLRQQGFTSSR